MCQLKTGKRFTRGLPRLLWFQAWTRTFPWPANESGTAVASTVEELPGYIYDDVDGVLTRQIDADIGTTCTIGYLTYKVISTLPAEVEVCGHHATARNYSVPETVEFDGYEFRVTKIGAGAFKDYVRIRTISMPYIEEIGSSAFYGCKYIKPADLDSVKIIGYKAFANCASMGAIEFGDSLENVSKYAFYCCSSLETITIPESVTMINAYAFYKCTSLKTLDMECASAAIGAKAFAHCTALEHVTMPDTISSLGSNAFYGLTFKNTADTTLSQTAANLSGKTFEGSGKILTQLA